MKKPHVKWAELCSLSMLLFFIVIHKVRDIMTDEHHSSYHPQSQLTRAKVHQNLSQTLPTNISVSPYKKMRIGKLFLIKSNTGKRIITSKHGLAVIYCTSLRNSSERQKPFPGLHRLSALFVSVSILDSSHVTWWRRASSVVVIGSLMHLPETSMHWFRWLCAGIKTVTYS